jgi:UTP--glucose-1-phosphate uridylyltransferase
VQRMAAAFERTGAGAIVAFEEVPRAEVGHYGIARPGPAADGLFRVEDLVEKPRPADAPSTLAIAARYCCRRRSSTRSSTPPPARAAKSS